jgi:hypothetical protein
LGVKPEPLGMLRKRISYSMATAAASEMRCIRVSGRRVSMRICPHAEPKMARSEVRSSAVKVAGLPSSWPLHANTPFVTFR